MEGPIFMRKYRQVNILLAFYYFWKMAAWQGYISGEIPSLSFVDLIEVIPVHLKKFLK
jgi:hypothetical protein